MQLGLLVSGGAFLVVPAVPAAAVEPSTTAVSVSSTGVRGNEDPGRASLSADGRFVAFSSGATNLVRRDTNGRACCSQGFDVFVHDRATATTRRVSVTSRGHQASRSSWDARISADGRFVAFVSSAPDLVRGDTNRQPDVFVHDRRAGTTSRISLDGRGRQGGAGGHTPAVSANGRFVAFVSASPLVRGDTNRDADVFVRDRKKRRTIRASVSLRGSQVGSAYGATAISANGRVVAFTSEAPGLVGGDTNRVEDVFVRDLTNATTTRVSVSSTGAQADGTCAFPSFPPCGGGHLEALSADGNTVVFSSSASNLVRGDTNDAVDVFLHDRRTRSATRVSVTSDGQQVCQRPHLPPDVGFICGSHTAAVSADGRFTAFYSEDPDLDRLHEYWPQGGPDVFIHDAVTGATERASIGMQEYGAREPGISADGRFLSFVSNSSPLVGPDQQVFVRGPLR